MVKFVYNESGVQQRGDDDIHRVCLVQYDAGGSDQVIEQRYALGTVNPIGKQLAKIKSTSKPGQVLLAEIHGYRLVHQLWIVLCKLLHMLTDTI